jgi:CubicO group peptidase (beta-lactamase class C family)
MSYKKQAFVLMINVFSAFFSITIAAADRTENSEQIWQLIKAYSDYDKTGEKRSSVNIKSYGEPTTYPSAELSDQRYKPLVDTSNNLGTVVFRDRKLVFERYSQIRNLDNTIAFNGMSMAKSAMSSVIGTLLCTGQIQSLGDPVKKYVPALADSPYANISLKDVLQMRSGVSKQGREGEGYLIASVLGLGKYDGKGSIVRTLLEFDHAATEPGSRFNYHQTDALVLSLVAEGASSKSVSDLFYSEIYSAFSNAGRIHWAADNQGITSTFSGLVMRGRDWAMLGQYILDEMKNESCLGNYFLEGIRDAVSTGEKEDDAKFGYMFWTKNINGTPILHFRGQGGQLLVMDSETNTSIFISSVNSNYPSGPLFSNLQGYLNR